MSKINNIPSYLCSWNNNEILEIHTIESLKEQYKDTNLFEDKDLFTTFGNGFDNLTINEYLKHSKEDKDFINVEFGCDNMNITRIK